MQRVTTFILLAVMFGLLFLAAPAFGATLTLSWVLIGIFGMLAVVLVVLNPTRCLDETAVRGVLIIELFVVFAAPASLLVRQLTAPGSTWARVAMIVYLHGMAALAIVLHKLVPARTMARIQRGIGLGVELLILATLAVAIACGGLDRGAGFWMYVFGAVAGLAALIAWGAPEKILGKLVTHGALVIGCLIFSFPFLWLVGTSFKYDEEIFVYPPKWLPSAPADVARSPYVTEELYPPVAPPASLGADRWDALWPQIEEALWRKGQALLGDRPTGGIDAGELRRTLTHGLWAEASGGVAKEAWSGEEEGIVHAVVERVDAERVEDVWGSIFRSTAIRDVTITDIGRVDRKLAETGFLDAWTGDGVRPVLRRGAKGGDHLRLEYDLADRSTATVAAVLPLPVAPEDLLSVTVPIRQDRSWHELTFALEFAGRRYVPADAQYLGQYRWQELVFKIASRDDRDERRIGIWPLVESDATGAFNEPGRMRLTIGIIRAGRIQAIWRKYTNSYRETYFVTEHLWNYVFNSVLLVVLCVLGQMFSCSLVAYAFARLNWPGREVLFGVLLATMMLPAQVTMIPVFMIFKGVGWYNTLQALWVPSFFGGAFFIFLLRQFMRGIPNELEDAAKIDGCGFFGVYWRVILPLMKPALAAVAIFTFMHTWNNFMGPLIYINDQRLYPLALGLFEFRTEHGGDEGLLMAASTMMTLPVIALFFLAQKYFIQGVTLTGLKG